MVNDELYSILALIAVTIPVWLLFTIGPEYSKRRGIYAISGLGVAGFIGTILFIISADTRYNWSSPWVGRLARDLTAAITEEIIRYPGILLAQYLGVRYSNRLKNPQETAVSSEDTVKEQFFVEGDFTTIVDPHGMGMYFGVGYGMGETIVFYMHPTVMEFINNEVLFPTAQEMTDIILRITGVIAHVALTYMAMAITSQKGFWRNTILLHSASNASNRIFQELAPNIYSNLVFSMFTRIAIVIVAYFLLRPKVRYLSPAVLLFILVSLFLLVILLASFIALLIGFFSVNLFPFQ